MPRAAVTRDHTGQPDCGQGGEGDHRRGRQHGDRDRAQGPGRPDLGAHELQGVATKGQSRTGSKGRRSTSSKPMSAARPTARTATAAAPSAIAMRPTGGAGRGRGRRRRAPRPAARRNGVTEISQYRSGARSTASTRSRAAASRARASGRRQARRRGVPVAAPVRRAGHRLVRAWWLRVRAVPRRRRPQPRQALPEGSRATGRQRSRGCTPGYTLRTAGAVHPRYEPEPGVPSGRTCPAGPARPATVRSRAAALRFLPSRFVMTTGVLRNASVPFSPRAIRKGRSRVLPYGR